MTPKEIESTLLFEIKIRDERWKMLKSQIEYEIEQAEVGLIASKDNVSFPKRTNEKQYGDEMFHEGMLVELRRIIEIMEKS